MELPGNNIYDPDETHMMKILLKDVKLSVRIGKEFGEKITTNIGEPQEDCLSPMFIDIIPSRCSQNRKIKKSQKSTTTAKYQ